MVGSLCSVGQDVRKAVRPVEGVGQQHYKEYLGNVEHKRNWMYLSMHRSVRDAPQP